MVPALIARHLLHVGSKFASPHESQDEQAQCDEREDPSKNEVAREVGFDTCVPGELTHRVKTHAEHEHAVDHQGAASDERRERSFAAPGQVHEEDPEADEREERTEGDAPPEHLRIGFGEAKEAVFPDRVDFSERVLNHDDADGSKNEPCDEVPERPSDECQDQ